MIELVILSYCGFALMLFVMVGLIKIALDIDEISFYIFVLISEIAIGSLTKLLYTSLKLQGII